MNFRHISRRVKIVTCTTSCLSARCDSRDNSNKSFVALDQRKMTVKSVRKASGSALLLKWVPCRTTRIGRDAAPPLAAPISAA